MQRSDLRPGFSSGKAGAKDAQLVSPRCGNPFSPQGNLASWLLFGQICDALRICLKRCFLPCTAAGVTDCHVASLLAMTDNNLRRVCVCKGRCRGTAGMLPRPALLRTLRAKRSCTRARALPTACHCEPVQNGNRGAPVRPGEGDAAERLKTWIFLRKSRGEGCAACIAEVWQSVLPAGKLGKLAAVWANS